MRHGDISSDSGPITCCQVIVDANYRGRMGASLVPSDHFVLLNDQPLGESEPDYLDVTPQARGLAELLFASRATTPFVLAIDGKWGTGKSSTMTQLAQSLEGRSEVEVVWFNAWRAGTAGALAGVINSVLGRMDRNVVRRVLRGARNRRYLLGGLRVVSSVALGFLHLSRLVDEMWAHAAVDAKARNEMRDVVRDIVRDWVDARDGIPRRMVVVFVDDLDRCGDDTVIEVCEAVKLYLDLPGIVFVLGCDLALLARPSMVPSGGDRELVRSYLEKIIQVNYRVPVPTEAQVEALIGGYAQRSGTMRIFTDPTRRLVAQRSAGNPRSIKRLINSFIVEYRLDNEWRDLGEEALMNAILLQHFHPDFYRLLTDTTSADVMDDFLNYRSARQALQTGELQTKQELVEATFKRFGLPMEGVGSPDPDVRREKLDLLDREVPAGWPELVRRAEFVSLLEGIGTAADRRRLQQRLRRQPLSTAPVTVSPLSSAFGSTTQRTVQGLRILWIDDEPPGNEIIIGELIDRGAEVRTAHNLDEALSIPLRPNVVISDVSREGVHDAGFRDAVRLRRQAGYQGPILFYTRTIGPEREERTRAVAPASITTNGGELVEWLETLAAWIDREDFTTPEFLAERPWLPNSPVNQSR
jgi:CheY-like chemotaxis protein